MENVGIAIINKFKTAYKNDVTLIFIGLVLSALSFLGTQIAENGKDTLIVR